MINDKNIIETALSELNITQKELAKLLGVHITSIKKLLQKDKLTSQVEKSIKLLLENFYLKKELENMDKKIKK